MIAQQPLLQQLLLLWGPALLLLSSSFHVLLLQMPYTEASSLQVRNSTAYSRTCFTRDQPTVLAFTSLLPQALRTPGGGNSSSNSSSCLFSRGRFRLHPRLRVRRLSRDSGSSHVLELSRQRLLLQREGDLEKYLNLPMLPYPAEGEVHSQRKRAKEPSPGGPLPGPLLLYRQAKQLLKKHSGTRNNRRVLLLRDRLSLLRQQQQKHLVDSPRSSVALLRRLWDIPTDSKHIPLQPRQQQEKHYEKENLNLQERRTRPLGSRFLYICGIDLRVTGTDLENIFQTITEHPVYARLPRNREGRHLGFGTLEFGSTLDATQCLLQLNGVKIGNSTIRLGEAFAASRNCHQLNPEPTHHQQVGQRGEESTGNMRRKRSRYLHPYPLPCG
ncbi:RNA recognition motif-containing protein, putative [Eimeria tenella]|uniref:RNA recognition motif-containing protein, putative n=1 Tax=Eimeria tenella TaxID=5802 RepID=U6L290_EIMTE|nr:RNA recognition motif-containing protein, putative [Eimeria tenella]CDJ41885.1 RNA recognition motif-containing protein, putative [Eimeria tenella]|eukprot:XP_013232635.1 RNA recognition motif-containing protein, putative [Eimeria tenella]